MAKGTIKRVEVDGRKYAVDMSRANSWTAVKLMAKAQSETSAETKGACAIAYADYVLGDTMQTVVDACGGADAPAEDVLKLAYDVIGAALKN